AVAETKTHLFDQMIEALTRGPARGVVAVHAGQHGLEKLDTRKRDEVVRVRGRRVPGAAGFQPNAVARVGHRIALECLCAWKIFARAAFATWRQILECSPDRTLSFLRRLPQFGADHGVRQMNAG